MPNYVKMFTKRHADKVQPGEQVLAVSHAQPAGAFARRSIAGGLGGVTGLGRHEQEEEERAEQRQGEQTGGAASWPPLTSMVLVVTDRRLIVFEGSGAVAVGNQAADYGLDGVARLDLRKKLTVNKLTVTFSDGSAVELDLMKGQKAEELVAAFDRARGA